ncbi:hypothetical protein A2U01_0089751, partial [Trifolium medium]|nr:hypothetical protein [Trifolium medium]
PWQAQNAWFGVLGVAGCCAPRPRVLRCAPVQLGGHVLPLPSARRARWAALRAGPVLQG